MNLLKHTLSLLCVFIVINPNAQAPQDSADFQGDLLYTFEDLDMSELTTNFFLDKAFPFIDLELFDGTVDSLPVTMDIFGAACATLHGAAMNESLILPDPSIYGCQKYNSFQLRM